MGGKGGIEERMNLVMRKGGREKEVGNEKGSCSGGGGGKEEGGLMIYPEREKDTRTGPAVFLDT